jgi:DNA-binding NarL/FixJ family response regulator
MGEGLNMIRIVIADDHTIMREGLKRILDGADDMKVVGEAVDGFEVLTQVRQGGFDLLMLDLSMPGRSFPSSSSPCMTKSSMP